MNLGQFSVSLAVKDIHASRAFYENLGFSVMDGKLKENWLILKNGESGQAFLSLEDPDGNQILMDQWPDDYKADPQL